MQLNFYYKSNCPFSKNLIRSPFWVCRKSDCTTWGTWHCHYNGGRALNSLAGAGGGNTPGAKEVILKVWCLIPTVETTVPPTTGIFALLFFTEDDETDGLVNGEGGNREKLLRRIPTKPIELTFRGDRTLPAIVADCVGVVNCCCPGGIHLGFSKRGGMGRSNGDTNIECTTASKW
uniref:Uncharacterized protein n=1 Tax=Glossina pallidipes TaxID=7398 RepID=A0A1B0A6L4_GLOPL